MSYECTHPGQFTALPSSEWPLPFLSCSSSDVTRETSSCSSRSCFGWRERDPKPSDDCQPSSSSAVLCASELSKPQLTLRGVMTGVWTRVWACKLRIRAWDWESWPRRSSISCCRYVTSCSVFPEFSELEPPHHWEPPSRYVRDVHSSRSSNSAAEEDTQMLFTRSCDTVFRN